MKSKTTRHLPLAAFAVMTLGTTSLLFGTSESAPEGASEIAEFIQMDVSADSKMKGTEITVEVNDEIAILRGSAKTLAQAERAVARAVATNGVRAVVNQVIVSPESTKDILVFAKDVMRSQKLITASGVKIQASGDRVILTGEVGTLDEKDLARELISEVPGVVAIENDLVVNFEGIRDDTQIQAQLGFMIKDDPLYEGLDLVATVKDGTVSLSGKVGTKGEYDRLVRRSYVTGVMDVQISNLSIESDLAMEGLSDKDYNKEESLIALNQALGADTRVDANSIKVGVEEGVVTLRGNVESVSAKDAVEAVSRAIPGVLRVENELKISANGGLASSEKKAINSSSVALVRDR